MGYVLWQECVAKARAVLPAGLLAALDAGNASEEASRRLDQLEQRSFLSHLLRLRQACCHPQVPYPPFCKIATSPDIS